MTRAEQQQQTRTRLLDAGESLFGDQGIHQTSLDEVAKVAGLTKGAIYANFHGKKDLIAAILERKLADGGEPSPGVSKAEWVHLASSGYESGVDRPEARRFVLAFVEFWLYGMRDEALRGSLTQWMRSLRKAGAEDAATILDGDSPLRPDQLATLTLALDIGITLQHLLDPDAVPADLYRTGLEVMLGRAGDDGSSGAR